MLIIHLGPVESASVCFVQWSFVPRRNEDWLHQRLLELCGSAQLNMKNLFPWEPAAVSRTAWMVAATSGSVHENGHTPCVWTQTHPQRMRSWWGYELHSSTGSKDTKDEVGWRWVPLGTHARKSQQIIRTRPAAAGRIGSTGKRASSAAAQVEYTWN